MVRAQQYDVPNYGYEVRQEEAEGPGLAEYWNILRRRKGTVILITAFSLVCAILITLPQTPVYQAKTTLEIQDLNENFLNMKQVSQVNEGGNVQTLTDIQTQIKILQSESLIERVLDKLKTKGPARPNPENGRVTAWRKALNLPEPAVVETPEALIKKSAKNLKVKASGQTRIIEATFDSTDPQYAADFANNVTNEFIEQNIEARWKMNERTGEWLSRQLDDMRIKLERSEDALQAYARRSGLMFTGDKQSVSEEKLRQLQEELSKAQADRIASQSKYEMLKGASLDLIPDAGDQQIQVRLAELRRELAELTTTYTAGHYKVRRVQMQIASVEKTLNEQRITMLGRIQKDYDGALRRENLLKADYNTQARLVNDESEKSVQYNILKREVDSNRQVYDSMLQRMKEAAVAAAIRASNIRVVDPAKTPRAPYKPNLPLNAGLGLLAGLFLGVGFVVVRERADRSVQDPGDLSMFLNVPELGVIPGAHVRHLGYYYRRHLKAAVAADPASEKVEVVTWRQKSSTVSESFRSVVTSILFTANNGDRPRVLVLTSPSPVEGKTTVASNLAIALAEINYKVVILDADLRKPRMHDLFGLENSAGLSDYLAATETGTLEPQKTEVPNLSVITSGPASHGATNLLYSPRMTALMARLRKEYDMVIVDTPPMLQMPDSRVLGRLADGVILVMRAHQTSRDAAQAAAQRFREDGTAVLGSILNDWNPKSSPKGYYGYYKGYYGGYYKHYYGREEQAP
jgi:polysaccharide biosynthesis transport protein